MKFQAKSIINAPAEKVWAVLSEAKNFPKFDTTCIRIEGNIAEGKKIKIFSKLSPKHPFTITVTRMTKPRQMVWESGMPFDLFKGVRTFHILAKDDATSEFYLEENFSGPLLFLMRRVIPDMSHAFETCAQGLKEFVESNKNA